MKKLITLFIAALAVSVSAQKLVVINMDQTFLKYYKTINTEKELKKHVRIMEDRAIQMENLHKKELANYRGLLSESISIINSDATRQKKKEEAEEKKEEITSLEKRMRAFNKEAQERIGKKHQQSRNEILKEIQKVIEMIAKNKGAEMVIDNSGKTSNLIPSVVYNKEELDITEEVLSILNKGNEKIVEEWEKEKEMKKKEAEAKAAAAEKDK